MAFTYQSVCDLARIPLNDADKTRHPDATLLSFANHGILQMAKRRPDLFIGNFSSMPTGEAALIDVFPLAPGYAQTLADYVTARVESIDDESANNGRAAAFMQLFGSEVPA